MSKKETTQEIKNPLDLVNELGPFEKAKNNLEKFAWNAMIAHATELAIKSLQEVEGVDTEEAKVIRLAAEATLANISILVRDRDGGYWN